MFQNSFHNSFFIGFPEKAFAQPQVHTFGRSTNQQEQINDGAATRSESATRFSVTGPSLRVVIRPRAATARNAGIVLVFYQMGIG